MRIQGDPRFLVDRTAGKLARWLRFLGFDVDYVDTCEPAKITRLARQSGRIALTRTRELADRMGADAILLDSEHLKDQVRQVIGEVGPDRCRPFSRCSICNVGLERIDRETVKGRVPRYVYDHHRDFAVCPGCGRYYWRGTHWKRMIDDIEELMEGMDDGDTEGGRGSGDSRS